MKFRKTQLNKMRKSELIELILKLQDINEIKSLYELTNGKNSIISKSYRYSNDGSKIRVKFKLTPGDVVEVRSERITPSGYPSHGSEVFYGAYDLKELLTKTDYKTLVQKGWNILSFDILKKYPEFNNII